MLQLNNIKKVYGEKENQVEALKGVTVSFGDKGLISVCGQSGCGKTTLLNIIGGLDRYTSGDLLINSTSTRDYKNRDWDRYRNHHVGFVFQNYYLIPQLSVLENVMMAMDISGESRSVQKKKAIEALIRVGLENQMKKKPKHLSGGQAQRVAIARAICNHPTILLADEPTGALDSENSVQILELLKEISKESLVIIVTHNNELAQAYSDRIIRMKDGEIVSDECITEEGGTVQRENNDKKTNISFGSSFLISLKNLYYKKGRTLLTSFAGCLGVIVISLILAFNAGFASYSLSFQKEQLSRYPITVEKTQSSLSDIGDIVAKMEYGNFSTLDSSAILNILTEETSEGTEYTEEEKIYIQKLITGLVANFDSLGKTNDTTELSKYIDEHSGELEDLCVIKKDYDLNLNVYRKNGAGYVQISPFADRVINSLTSSEINFVSKLLFGSTLRDKEKSDIAGALGNVGFWDSLIENRSVLDAQYDVLAGSWPSSEGEEEGVYEVVIVVDEYNQITDAALYALGEIEIMQLVCGILRNSAEAFGKTMNDMTNGDFNVEGMQTILSIFQDIPTEYGFDDFLYEESEKEYYLLADTDYYAKNEEGEYESVKGNTAEENALVRNKSVRLRVSGIVRPKQDVAGGCINGVIGYPQSLAKYVINTISSSDIITDLQTNYQTYLSLIESEKYQAYEALSAAITSKERDLEAEPLTMEEAMLMAECRAYCIENVIAGQEGMDVYTYEALLSNLGLKQLDVPESIFFYPYSIEASEKIISFLDRYNAEMKSLYESGEAERDNSVEYKNELKDIMNSLNGMIDNITWILIAVTFLSVLVSAIMVGIITYISVHDRTKEIGILRSMGARRFDIMNIFNVETALLGLFSGVIGIAIGYLVTLPLNSFLKEKLLIANLITPLWWHSLILIIASVVLNCLSGLIPAIWAAGRDPVTSLRSE